MSILRNIPEVKINKVESRIYQIDLNANGLRGDDIGDIKFYFENLYLDADGNVFKRELDNEPFVFTQAMMQANPSAKGAIGAIQAMVNQIYAQQNPV
jgi:hypothetical protein